MGEWQTGPESTDGAGQAAGPAQLSLFAAERSVHRASTPRALLAPAAELAEALSARLGVPVRLRVTDNRSSLVHLRHTPEGLRVRLHHLFLGAPGPVVDALAEYAVRRSAEAQARLAAHVRAHEDRVRRERGREAPPLRTRGRCFDLAQLFDALKARHFAGEVQARVGWGRRPSRRRRKSIQLSTWDARAGELRVHPALDAPDVPAFVVEFALFHAMLHAHAGTPAGQHPPSFEERERAYPRRDAALHWREEHLGQLLSPRAGTAPARRGERGAGRRRLRVER